MRNKCRLCKKYDKIHQFFCENCLSKENRPKTFEERLMIIVWLDKSKQLEHISNKKRGDNGLQ